MMGHGHFAGLGNGAAADQGLGGGRVMGGSNGTLIHQCDAIGEQTHGGIDAGGFKGFSTRERRKDGGHALGEHGFAGAGRADHQNVVISGTRDGDRALDGFLAADIGEIEGGRDLRLLIGLAIKFIGFQRQQLVEE